MQTLHNLQILAISITLAISLNSPVQARIKCWDNKDGIRECGDTVPPEYAQSGHQELDDRGFIIEEQDRAKSEAELKEEARLAAIEEEKQRKKEEQELLDRILTETYVSVSDIELSREEHLSVIESTISLTKKRNEKIQEDLDKRMALAERAESRGKTPDDGLVEEIESLQRRISNNNKFIEDKEKEKEGVIEEFRIKIDRFKELKGIED